MTDRVVLINPNTSTATTDLIVGIARDALAARAMPALAVVGATVSAGPPMITTAADLAASAPAVVETALAALAEAPVAAFVIGAFGDPGADELSGRCAVPVIGIGAAAVRAAAAHGRRFAIATTTPDLRLSLAALAERHSPAGSFVGTFFSESDPNDLAAKPAALVAELSATVDRAVAAGAQAVIIGGGPLSAAARAIARRRDVVIVEPVPAAMAEVIDHYASRCAG